MTIQLKETDFVNGRFEVNISETKRALFVIVDEFYESKIGKMVVNSILVTTYEDLGDSVEEVITQSSIIGLGNNNVGIMTDNRALLGKTLTKDNMVECTVLLYE